MEKPETICGLCQESKPLVSSHLIPASLYKLLRDANSNNPNPVVIDSSRAKTSSRQVQKPFLCTVCEDRLSQRGELLMAPNCARMDSFPLLEKLKTIQPLIASESIAAFDLREVFAEQAEAFLYFPASVFWRASATSWPGVAGRLIDLGPYEEPLRKYLLGEEALPETITIFMMVAIDAAPQIVSFPAEVKIEGRYRKHQFIVPGIVYSAMVGNTPERVRDVRMNRDPAMLAMVGPLQQTKLYENIVSWGKSVRLSNALRQKYGLPPL